ncbi:MAG TPA: nucleotide sugar dehydrogenase [candidate division Zixibacteria bacterium]|nr:nucleotide sugar dehydrogenase [candidate division Zixibacteria bacterium]
MSTPIMQAKAEEMDTPEKLGNHTVSIIGCGQTGILQAVLFADAGFKVTCVDADQTTVNRIAKGKTSLKSETEAKLKNHAKTGRLTATNDIAEAVSHSDIIIITTPIKISSRKKTEYSDLENTCKKIGPNLRSGSLIIVTSLTRIGLTEGLVKETLENTSGLKAGTDFGLAYSPIQTLHTLTCEEAANHQRIVAATDKDSLRIASFVLEKLAKRGLRRTDNVKAAEVAALLEVLQRDINIALANETALLCERVGVDYAEAVRIIGTDKGKLPPAATLADDSLSDEPYLLLEDAESFNIKPRVATAARDTNEQTVTHVVNLVKDALKSCGKTLKRARIALLGVSQAPNAQSPIKRTARKIIDTLEARGAKISLYDPYISESEITETSYHFKKNLTEAMERADCLIVLTAHDQFKHLNLRKMKLTMKMPAAIIDLEGVTEPSKIEKEGFVYRGYGRGVWTK